MGFITNITTTPVTGTYGADGLPINVDNDQGNIRGGGTIAETGSFSSSSFGEGNEVVTIVSGVGGVDGTNTALAASTFNSGLQVINFAQTTIAGASNTALQGGQSNSANDAKTPMSIDVVRTYYYKTAVVAGNWNVFTGAFSSISNATSGVYDIDKAGDTAATVRGWGTDVAANTTQDSPGRLTYRDGSANPTNGAYGARYNW